MKYIYLTFLGFILACSSSNFEQEKIQINSIITQYDSLFQSADTINLDSVGPNLKRYNEVLKYSQTRLSTEQKPSLKTMTYLNDLKLMKRQFKNAPKQKKSFVTNIIRSQEQLNNLLTDIDNSIFDKDELKAVITREKQAFEAISIQVSEFENTYNNYQIRFDSLYQLSSTFKYE